MVDSMRIVGKLASLIIFIISAYTAHAADVKVEVKGIEDNTVFIFSHDRSTTINVNFQNNIATIIANQPVKPVLVNGSDIKKIAESPILSSDGKSFSIETKEKYRLVSKIDGERLTAIKLSKKEKDLKTRVEEQVVNVINEEQLQKKVTEANLVKRKVFKVQVVNKNEAIEINFPFQQIPNSAVFRRGDDLWVALDAYVEFLSPKSDKIQEWVQINNDKTVLKIKSQFKYARTSYSKGNFTLYLSNLPSKNISVISPEMPEAYNEDLIVYQNQVFTGSTKLKILDPNIGDEIMAVLVKKTGDYIINQSSNVDYEVFQSHIGLALAVKHNDLQVENHKDKVTILSKYEIPDAVKQSKDKKGGNQLVSMIPTMSQDILNRNFVQMKVHLLHELINSPSEREYYDRKIDLAQFYFMHSLYHESMGIIDGLTGANLIYLNDDKSAYFIKAVNLSMIGKYTEAKTIYDKLTQLYSGVLPEEVVIFKNYNAFMQGNTPPNIGVLNNINKYLANYPDDIYYSLVFAEIDMDLQQNNLKALEAMFKSIRTPTKPIYVNTLKYYKANYYRKKSQNSLAKQLLAELSNQQEDKFNSTRAELDLVTLLYTNKEISPKEALKRLESRRFDWRGDKIEYNLLVRIADIAKEMNDTLYAMRTYKYILGAYGALFHNFYISSELVKLYNQMFLLGGDVEKMNDFDAVALFYEFKDIIPIGEDGDNIAIMIAKKMINLDLLDSASQLLKHQVDYRLSGQKRVLNADHLALIYLMDNKPKDAVDVLNSTDSDALTYQEYVYRQELKAKAYIDMGKYQEALTYLPTEDEDGISMAMRKEVYFKSKNWKRYIDYVKPMVAPTIHKVTGEAVQDVVRLAIAYSMLNDTAALENLNKNMKTDNEHLKAVIDFMLITNQPVDYRNLDKSLKIDQMSKFMNESKQRLFK